MLGTDVWEVCVADPAANILLFVYSGFEQNRYYWEFLVFARKVALGLVVVVTTDAQVSGLLGLIILQTASILQVYGKPYRHRIVNIAETGALFATSLAVYIGLFHFVSDNTEHCADFSSPHHAGCFFHGVSLSADLRHSSPPMSFVTSVAPKLRSCGWYPAYPA